MIIMVLKSVVLPVLVGGGTIALCWLLPPLRKWGWLCGSAFGLAISLAVFGAWFAENGMPTFPVGSRSEWIGIAAAFAFVCAVLASLTGLRAFPVPPLTALVVGALLAAAPVINGLAGGKDRPLFADMGIADQLAIGFAVAVGYLALHEIAERRNGLVLPLAFMIAFGALAPLADHAGWISLTFVAMAASATCLVAAVCARFGGSPAIGRGGLIAAVILLAVLSVAGYRQTFHEIPWWCFLLVAGSPAVLLLFEFKVFDKVPPWGAATLRLAAVVILVAMGLLYGLSGGEPDVDPMMGFQ
jgi:hypothetical protein